MSAAGHARRVAIIGGGWAGIAAAVHASLAGHRVSLFEMARELGGRARRVEHEGIALDNGQHILIGAYRDTLALMRLVGASPETLLLRKPLALVNPAGAGIRLPAGSPSLAFLRALLVLRGWTWSDRLAMLGAALRWRRMGFEAVPDCSVAVLMQGLPQRVRETLIEPLCVAALNTPARQASACVFLRVVRDALFAGPGSADLLLPRAPLSQLLPEPAQRWLTRAGADLRCGTRVMQLHARDQGWEVDGEAFDGVVLACSAVEAARLAQPVCPSWAAVALSLKYEPIVTVYLRSRGSRLPEPMTALACGSEAPAQFAFDLGAIDGGGSRDGLFAFALSGASDWVSRGLPATTAATLRQAALAFHATTWREPLTHFGTLAERRATFLCKPELARPCASVAKHLVAAGDYVAGPYPATLEGAVRSGIQAQDSLFAQSSSM